MSRLSFSIASAAFDRSLLPPEAGSVATPAFREAVSAFLQKEFQDFGGRATIRVDDQTILVQWDADSKQPNPLVPIVEKLRQGRQAEGIQLLELLLSHRPDDSVVLYNLGLALSDAGRLERAEAILTRAADLNPNDVNIKVALGVALGRLRRDAEATAVLKAAAEQDPKNPWARRNLGGILLKAGQPEEAIPHSSMSRCNSFHPVPILALIWQTNTKWPGRCLSRRTDKPLPLQFQAKSAEKCRRRPALKSFAVCGITDYNFRQHVWTGHRISV
jgi:TPR repeat protein